MPRGREAHQEPDGRHNRQGLRVANAVADGMHWPRLVRLRFEEVGFIQHPKIEGAGCSPDGLIGLDGGLELKCPGQAKHIKNLMGGTIDKGYMLQMQWSMECTGREWWDFGSFNPDFPDHLKISIRRVERNAEVCEELKAATTTFLEEMESKLLVLEGMAA